jgi:predicted flap endonuclease-1-like 5' DNA nuclease
MRRKHGAADAFAGLRNIGPAARADLGILGITSLEQLAASDPDQLYALLQIKTARKHDPCVRDVFAAAIHQARTGESRDWWAFTRERKIRRE